MRKLECSGQSNSPNLQLRNAHSNIGTQLSLAKNKKKKKCMPSTAMQHGLIRKWLEITWNSHLFVNSLSVINLLFITSPKNFIRLFFSIKYKAFILDIVWSSHFKAESSLVSDPLSARPPPTKHRIYSRNSVEAVRTQTLGSG